MKFKKLSEEKIRKGVLFLNGRVQNHNSKSGFFFKPWKGLYKRNYSDFEVSVVRQSFLNFLKKKDIENSLLNNLIKDLEDYKGKTLDHVDKGLIELYIQSTYRKEVNLCVYRKYETLEEGLVKDFVAKLRKKVDSVLQIDYNPPVPKPKMAEVMEVKS